MVTINYALREINCKIVYYGPGLSGKTTNLQFVHGKVPATARGDLISLATEADRTLYFDFLPVDVGKIAGFDTKFQLYTVPGQVFYNATRRLVLRGVDGLVFVADSQTSKMDENIESLNNMYENMTECGIDYQQLPLVFQWNKRDLPDILPVSYLGEQLNPQGLPSFEAVAITGVGVFDTLKKITKMVLEGARERAAAKSRRSPAATEIAQKPAKVAAVSAITVGNDSTVMAPPRIADSEVEIVEPVPVGMVESSERTGFPPAPARSRAGSISHGPLGKPDQPVHHAHEYPGRTAPSPSPAIYREPSLKVRGGSSGGSRARRFFGMNTTGPSIFARFFRWIFGR